jgi:hypothetical protein
VALSEEQRALLRLLLAGDSVSSIAALLGTDPSEVRSRADAALARLAEEDPEEARTTADRLRRVLAADEEGAQPTAAVKPTDAARGTGLPPRPGRSPRVRDGNRRRLALRAVFALSALALIATVLVAGGFLSGSEEPTTSSGDDIAEDVVEIELTATGGGAAGGQARLIRVEDRPVLDFDLNRLPPTGRGEVYVVWLLASNRALPVAFQRVGEDGVLQGQVPIASAAISLLQSVNAIDVSLARADEVRREIDLATGADRLPRPIGRSVLRGDLG